MGARARLSQVPSSVGECVTALTLIAPECLVKSVPLICAIYVRCERW